MSLLNTQLLQDTTTKHQHEIASSVKQGLKELFKETLDLINSNKFEKEESEKIAFLIKMFELLGYKHHKNLSFEKSTKYRGSIDGNLKEENGNTVVAIEWKGIDTKDLQRSGKAGETPVDQLFRYMSETQAEFGLVGNFIEFRLYSWKKRKDHFQKFELKELVQSDDLLNEFIFLLKPSMILKTGKNSSELENLLDKSELEQEQITKHFYNDYKQRRLNLFQHLVENNPETNKHILLEKSQKILDRLIFVMFCEDNINNLLPKNILKDTYNLGKNNRSRSETKIWEQFQYLFEDIDKGRYDIQPNINAYNGGLFAEDLKLNSLVIKDEVWEWFNQISEKYDFESDLNVNILGHIFEQSISDIEEIKSEIEGETTDKKKSKRKKDGIYYTPEYITDYIVSETIGGWLNQESNQVDQIKVLDPAGGSGAFPNQVHNYLAKKHVENIKAKAENDGFDPSLVDIDENQIDKSILKNNIFMVDLQPESVEIAKLSLWLKTAKKDQKLDNLDSNIKCGNSLINDPEITGDKAFDWSKEFPEVMASGGFDVVIGNPPYVSVRGQDEATRKYLAENYQFSKGADLYVAFIEKSLKLLKHGGCLGFICPNKFFGADYGKKIRHELQFGNFEIVNIWDLKDEKVFEDAFISTVVIIIRKGKTNKKITIRDKNGVREVENVFDEGGKIQIEQDEEAKKIIEIMNQQKPLENYAEIRTGVMGFEYWKMEEIISENKTDNSVAIYTNGNIARYDDLWETKTIDLYKKKYNKPVIETNANFLNKNTITLFKTKPKILVRGVSQQVSGIIDNNGSGLLVAVHSIIPKPNINIKYLLAVINSNIINWYHLKTFYSVKIPQGSLKYPVSFFSSLPVPESTPEQQAQIATLVDEIMALKKEMQDYIKNTFILLQAELDGQKINLNKKLERFWQLDFTDFLAELTKQKMQISHTQKRALINTFDVDKIKLFELEKEVARVDTQIEGLVRGLYKVDNVKTTVVNPASADLKVNYSITNLSERLPKISDFVLPSINQISEIVNSQHIKQMSMISRSLQEAVNPILRLNKQMSSSLDIYNNILLQFKQINFEQILNSNKILLNSLPDYSKIFEQIRQPLLNFTKISNQLNFNYLTFYQTKFDFAIGRFKTKEDEEEAEKYEEKIVEFDNTYKEKIEIIEKVEPEILIKFQVSWYSILDKIKKRIENWDYKKFIKKAKLIEDDIQTEIAGTLEIIKGFLVTEDDIPIFRFYKEPETSKGGRVDFIFTFKNPFKEAAVEIKIIDSIKKLQYYGNNQLLDYMQRANIKEGIRLVFNTTKEKKR